MFQKNRFTNIYVFCKGELRENFHEAEASSQIPDIRSISERPKTPL